MKLSEIWQTIKAEAAELVETARDLKTADWRSWLQASRGTIGVGMVRWAISSLNERAFEDRFGTVDPAPLEIQFFGFAPLGGDAADTTGVDPEADPVGVYCMEHRCDMGSCTLLHDPN